MKKIALVLLLTVVAVAANAQTEKGCYLLGGSLRVTALSRSDDITVTPSAGYFFIKNFVAGTALDFGYSKSGESPRIARITTLGVGPFVRYYIGNNQTRPFFHGDVNFSEHRDKIGSEVPTTGAGASYFLGPGLAYFFHRHTSLEGFAGYEHIATAHHLGNGGFELRIGFRFI